MSGEADPAIREAVALDLIVERRMFGVGVLVNRGSDSLTCLHNKVD